MHTEKPTELPTDTLAAAKAACGVLQPNDEFGVVIKTTPGPGTIAGVYEL